MPDRMLTELQATRRGNEAIRVELTKVWQRLRAHRGEQIALAVVVVAVIVLSFFAWRSVRDQARSNRLAADQSRAVVECVREWAKQTTDRTTAVSEATRTRQKALDDLIRTIPLKSAAKFNAALSVFLRASDAYEKTVKANPVPAAPELSCDLPVSPRPTPTHTAFVQVPGPTVTRSVTIPAITIPGGTTTVYVPKPGATVIVPGPVRTATVTVRPPARTVPGPVVTVTVTKSRGGPR